MQRRTSLTHWIGPQRAFVPQPIVPGEGVQHLLQGPAPPNRRVHREHRHGGIAHRARHQKHPGSPALPARRPPVSRTETSVAEALSRLGSCPPPPQGPRGEAGIARGQAGRCPGPASLKTRRCRGAWSLSAEPKAQRRTCLRRLEGPAGLPCKGTRSKSPAVATAMLWRPVEDVLKRHLKIGVRRVIELDGRRRLGCATPAPIARATPAPTRARHQPHSRATPARWAGAWRSRHGDVMQSRGPASEAKSDLQLVRALQTTIPAVAQRAFARGASMGVTDLQNGRQLPRLNGALKMISRAAVARFPMFWCSIS
eukprot:scaffold1659_cov255-Pinguiococcus_pyrenoidosus.AAC.57